VGSPYDGRTHGEGAACQPRGVIEQARAIARGQAPPGPPPGAEAPPVPSYDVPKLGEPHGPIPPGYKPPPQMATTYVQPSNPTPAPSPMFQKGLADRTAWEQWVASLPADHRAGAEYWAGQRSLTHPGTCYGVPAFTTGCEAAKARLTAADAQRKSEPDYKLGWNSYGH
jgi:hypothetical protein